MNIKIVILCGLLFSVLMIFRLRRSMEIGIFLFVVFAGAAIGSFWSDALALRIGFINGVVMAIIAMPLFSFLENKRLSEKHHLTTQNELKEYIET